MLVHHVVVSLLLHHLRQGFHVTYCIFSLSCAQMRIYALGCLTTHSFLVAVYLNLRCLGVSPPVRLTTHSPCLTLLTLLRAGRRRVRDLAVGGPQREGTVGGGSGAVALQGRGESA